jgi:hypothetical protein
MENKIIERAIQFLEKGGGSERMCSAIAEELKLLRTIKPDCHFYDDECKKWVWAYSTEKIDTK